MSTTPVLRLGNAELRRVEEMRLPSQLAHVTQDLEFIEANRSWLSPGYINDANGWDIVFQSWILNHEGRTVVIDPCTGNNRPHCQPWFDNLDLPYIERFSATGYRPEDVDFVFCTHMHHDHCGWNTQLRGGKWLPTFPNARYLFARREFERWDSLTPGFRNVDYNEGVYERSVLPVMQAGLADLIGDSHKVLDGLTILAAPGHTLGHAMAHLQSGETQAYFSGDVFHHPLQLVRPEIQFGDCDDVDAATATRRRLVELGADSQAWIIPAHLPTPHYVKVRRDGVGFAFSAA
jgi:glyoxylase-like metal-dependent hydrolase (beta-lactamase superfamily II)